MGLGKPSTTTSPLKNFTLKTFFSKHLLLAVSLTIISTIPLIPSFYFGEPVMFQNHDHTVHLIRLWHIQKAFNQGVFTPTWLSSLTFGLGSPLFLFNWFLPYYLGLPFRWLDFSLSDTIKILFILSNLIAGISIYILAKKITDHVAGLIAIPFYLLNPYRINVILTRGAIGEAIGTAMLPLVLIFAHSNKKSSKIALPIILTILIFMHNTTALLAFGILLLFLFFDFNKKRLKLTLVSILIALSMASFFWLPAIIERNNTHFKQAQDWYHTQFPSFSSLLSSAWQYGPPQPERQHLSMSFQIGKVHWMIFLTSIFFVLIQKKLSSKQKKFYTFLIALFLVSIFLQLKLSKFLWDEIFILRILLFPWRFQAISVLAISLIVSIIIFKKKHKHIYIMALLILLLIANRNHFSSARGEFASDEYIIQQGHAGDSAGEFLPINADLEEYYGLLKGNVGIPEDIIQKKDKVIIISKQVTETSIMLEVNAEKEEQIVVNQYYFPGWEGKIDGESVEISANLKKTKGRMNLNMPKGRHILELVFKKTNIRRITQIVSVISLVVFLWLSGRFMNSDLSSKST